MMRERIFGCVGDENNLTSDGRDAMVLEKN